MFFAAGDYNVIIPEDTVSGLYQIRVGLYENMELFGCSGSFAVVSEVDEDLDTSDMSYSMSYGYDESEGDELFSVSFSFDFSNF